MATTTFTLPDPTATLNAIMTNVSHPSDTVTGPDGTTYYLLPNGPGGAQWYGAGKGSTVAVPVLNPTSKPTLDGNNAGMTVKSLNTAQSSYYSANPTASAKAAAAAAPANQAANQATAAATPAAPAKSIQQLQNDFINQLNSNTVTQDQIDAYTAGVQAQGGTPAASLVTRANNIVSAANQAQQMAKATPFQNQLTAAANAGTLTKAQVSDIVNQAQAAGVTLDPNVIAQANQQAQTILTNNYQNQLGQAKTTDDLNNILAQAKSAGVTLDPGVVQQATTAVNQQQAQQAAAALQAKTSDYNTQMSQATTQAQVDSITAKAKADGVTIAPAALQQAQGAVQQQQAIQSFASKLGTPTGFTNTTGPNGQNFVSVAADPTTKTAGGWYQQVGTGFQQVDANGQTTGPVIPADQFNKMQSTAQQDVSAYTQQQTQQAAATKMATDVKAFESALPQPGTAAYTNAVNNRFSQTGPNGQVYEPTVGGGWVVSQMPTGQVAPGANTTFVPVGNPTGPTQTEASIQQGFTAQAAAQNAAAQTARSNLIASQQAKANGGFDWGTMLTIVGGIGLMALTDGLIDPGTISGLMDSAAGDTLTSADLVDAGIDPGTLVSNAAADPAYAPAVEQAGGTIDPVTGDVTAVDPTTGEVSSVTTPPAEPVTPTEVPTTATPEPTGPVAPGEATTPVSEGPQVPNGPQAPYNIQSIPGVTSDSPGTIFTNADGTQEIALDSGKVVNLADYQAAQASGQPISVDGQMTTGSNVTVELTQSPTEPPGGWGSQPTPTEPVAPTEAAPTPTEAPAPTEPVTPTSPGPAGLELPTTGGGTIDPTTVLTPTQILALGGVAAAAVAIATMGAGGAASAANAAIAAPVTAPTAPVTPPTTPTAPVTPPTAPTAPPTTAPVAPPTTAPGTAPTTTPVAPGTAPGGTGITPGGSGTTPGAINPGTPTSPTGTAPGTLSPGTPSGSYTPQPTVPGTQGGVAPTVTPPGPGNPVQITDYSTPYTMPDGTPVDTSGWSLTDIATALAAGYIVAGALGAFQQQPNLNGYKQQFLPIPTYNSSGLVNPGVNPGYIEPAAAYPTGVPGQDQYYWGQHQYAQNISDLANLNAPAPAQPYGNPNPIGTVNGTGLLTPQQMGFPNAQEMAAAYGPGQYNPAPILAQDQYTGLSQLNTPAPAVPGFAQTYAAPSQAQQAVGHGPASQFGQSINYAFTPAQLATTNNSGSTPASQLTSISPSQLSAQLLAAANAAGGS